jgi:hypothetical protein
MVNTFAFQPLFVVLFTQSFPTRGRRRIIAAECRAAKHQSR